METITPDQAIREFKEAAIDAGLIIEGDPVADGKIHNVPVEGARNAGNQSGRYLLHLDDYPAGWIKNWKTGDELNWQASGFTRPLGQADRSARKAQIEREAAEREARRRSVENRVAAYATRALESQSRPNPAIHPYLTRKGVLNYSLRVDLKNRLMVPMQDAAGKVWSLQLIDSEGQKHFLRGGRMQGTFSVLGDIEDGKPLAIAEGYATAATVRQATGLTAVVAFNSGNLEHVATSLHDRYPHSPIVIAGDNDHHLPNRADKPLPNAGAEKARAAAEAVGGYVAIPEFSTESGGTDWNDYQAEHGLDAVREAFSPILQKQVVEQKIVHQVKAELAGDRLEQREIDRAIELVNSLGSDVRENQKLLTRAHDALVAENPQVNPEMLWKQAAAQVAAEQGKTMSKEDPKERVEQKPSEKIGWLNAAEYLRERVGRAEDVAQHRPTVEWPGRFADIEKRLIAAESVSATRPKRNEPEQQAPPASEPSHRSSRAHYTAQQQTLYDIGQRIRAWAEQRVEQVREAFRELRGHFTPAQAGVVAAQVAPITAKTPTVAPPQEPPVVARSTDVPDWVREAERLHNRVSRLEKLLFPEAAAVALVAESWEQAVSALDQRLSKVESSLGIERAAERSASPEQVQKQAPVKKQTIEPKQQIRSAGTSHLEELAAAREAQVLAR